MSKKTRNFWIEAAILVLLIGAGAVAFTISAMAPLDRSDVKILAGDLRTFAAAGRLLALQYSRGETTETFFRNQAELLRDKVSDEESSLRGAKTDPEVRSALGMITSLASELSGALFEMQHDNDATESAAKLESLTHRLSQQEDVLK